LKPIPLLCQTECPRLRQAQPVYFPRFSHIGVVAWLFAASWPAVAAELPVDWPSGWTVEPLPPLTDVSGAHTLGSRQRAAKLDAQGDPLMVVELTRTQLEPGHQVNLPGVLLQMRKNMQVHLSQGGYQSLCTQIHEAQLGGLPAVETTCKIQLNGGHVMTQTLVAAAQGHSAYSLSYAGSAAGYVATQAQVGEIRASLKLSE
jgi:hypothetical protein